MKSSSELFNISLEGLRIAWSGKPLTGAPLGTLLVDSGREQAAVVAIGGETRAPDLVIGPALGEDQEYLVWLEAPAGNLELRHRDPRVTNHLVTKNDGQVLYGAISFRSAAGLSDFEVFVNGRRQLRFSVEVFPTKLDYRHDFRLMLADIQAYATSLALDLISSTYLTASMLRGDRKPGAPEWIAILNSILEQLETAFFQIARSPIWSLKSHHEVIRPERIRRGTLTQARRLVAKGLIGIGADGIQISARRVESQVVKPSLDGPEHQWLKATLNAIRHKLQHYALAILEVPSDRSLAAHRQILALSASVDRLLTLEPVAEAQDRGISAYASVSLMTKPGYREAYALLNQLQRGLILEGSAVKTDLKDIATLYEYWCFITLVKLAAELLGDDPAEQNIAKLDQKGLKLDLQRGQPSAVRFERGDGLRVELAYNRSFKSSEAVLFDQRPDVLITLRDNRAELYLVLDAKYRVERERSVPRFGLVAPPEDAINALYRYRDAIIRDSTERCVVQAVALYPGSAAETSSYASSKLARAVDTFGVGAIPFLPGNESFVADWLRKAVTSAGWQLAKRTPRHVGLTLSTREEALSRQIALVDVLPKTHREERIHKFMQGSHYVPLSSRLSSSLYGSRAQRRKLATEVIAIFDGVQISHIGQVDGLEVVQRRDIPTNYPGSLDPDTPCVLYQLKACRELHRGITASTPVSGARWTSGLALDLASDTSELLIELVEEWRLYRSAQAVGFKPKVRAGRYDEGATGGHVSFDFGSFTARFRSGVWQLRDARGDTLVSSLEEVLDRFSSQGRQ